jgi:hypothetical protein
MIRKMTFLFVCFLSFVLQPLHAAVTLKDNLTESQTPQNIFQVEKPDYKLSPYTGMTRQHWKDAALYLLKGAFSYIHTLDDPMKFPKQEGKSYPRTPEQVPTEKLEGLCRTLFIAAPLLKEDPNLTINGIKVADYYRHQISLLVDPQSESFIKLRDKNTGPHQNLVEFGALSISMFIVPDLLWKPLSQAQKDALAATMLSYGDGPTHPNNWKFFNIFILSYFKNCGYAVNDALLTDYLQKTLQHYRGEGWYNDNPSYDYYSMWAFQMYGMLWSDFYGKKNYPEVAKQLADNFKAVKDNYPYMFSRKGELIMWGRSISYRFGAVVPFPLMGLERAPETNYGWMRRIASGGLLQFLQNPSLLKDNVPTLGFYGPFETAVQAYSCRGSVFWCGKAFLGLLVPEDNPFWQATENEGAWNTELKKNTVNNKYLKRSNILITDYPNIGAAEIRAWCNSPQGNATENYRGNENYNRLSYNSAFPWQTDGKDGDVAMNYVMKNAANQWEPLRMFTFSKFEDGVYYRDAVFETNQQVRLKLADIPLSNGIMRVDKNLSTDAVELRLGHYALPKLQTPVKEETRKVNGYEVKIIDNGVYQLAMVNVKGWDGMQFVHSRGLHPAADESTVINVIDQFVPDSKKDNLYITLMLWKKSGEQWTDAELLPVKKLDSSRADKLTITFTDNSAKIIDLSSYK